MALLLVWSGALQGHPHFSLFAQRLREITIGEAAVILYAVLMCALITLPMGLSLLRLLEGYWGTSAGYWLAEHRQKRYQAHLLRLRRMIERRYPAPEAAKRHALYKLRHHYPPEPARVMPTRLGNTLRAAEDRVGQLHRLETVAVWPRLFPLLSDNVSAIVVDERNQLDLAARLCVVFLASALVYLGTLLWPFFHGTTVASRWHWFAVPAASLVLCWFSYRGAVNAAVGLGTGMATAFDLHRFDLLKALHLKLPDNRADELETNAMLTALLTRGEAALKGRPMVYEHDINAEEVDKRAPDSP